MDWNKVAAFLKREADLAQDNANALEISGKLEARNRAKDRQELCYLLWRAIEIGMEK